MFAEPLPSNDSTSRNIKHSLEGPKTFDFYAYDE
jgi:hypothetical protein